MQITPQIAVFVFLLLPGLLGHALLGAFTYTEKPTWSGRTVVAILLSAAAYLSLALLREWSWMSWLPDPRELLAAADKGITATFDASTVLCVFAACVLGSLYAILLVLSHNHRTLYRAAAWCGLTTKSGYVNEWDSVMIRQARSRWVLIAMKDGSSFAGWLISHDVCSNDRCVVLSNVRQTDADDGELVWPETELFVLNSMADVRFLRLINREEVNDGEASEHEVITVRVQNHNALGESEPKPGAKRTRPLCPDEAEFIKDEGEVTTICKLNNGATNGKG